MMDYKLAKTRKKKETQQTMVGNKTETAVQQHKHQNQWQWQGSYYSYRHNNKIIYAQWNHSYWKINPEHIVLVLYTLLSIIMEWWIIK